MRGPWVATGLVLSMIWPAGASALQKPSSKHRVLPDFDSRAAGRTAGTLAAPAVDEPLARLEAGLARPLRTRRFAWGRCACCGPTVSLCRQPEAPSPWKPPEGSSTSTRPSWA